MLLSIPALLFYKLYPGGNTTLLVHDNTLVPKPDTATAASSRASIACELMNADKDIEQVGFINTSAYAAARADKDVAHKAYTVPHMVMMGGEFCINACRSAALVFALTKLLPEVACAEDGKATAWEGVITTSGVQGNLPVRVRVAEGQQSTDTPVALQTLTSYDAAVALELPEDATTTWVSHIAPGETVVKLPGITHLLLDAKVFPLPQDAVSFAAAKRHEHNLDKDEAAGVIWYRPEASGLGVYSITPIVRVKATDSSVMETACGSGSLALALLLAPDAREKTPFTVRQPSGASICVFFETTEVFTEAKATQASECMETSKQSRSEQCFRAWIDGPIHLVEEGMLSR